MDLAFLSNFDFGAASRRERITVIMEILFQQSGCQLKSFASYPGSGSADIFFDGTPMYNVPRRINSTDVFVSKNCFLTSLNVVNIIGSLKKS